MEEIGLAAKGVATLASKFGVGRLVDRWYDPKHAKKMNQVECENRVREAKTDLDIAKIRKEAREIDRQANVDLVIGQAARMMPEDARPHEIDEEWANDVVEKIKVVEDEEMQRLWAKLIAGKAVDPGSFSKRTVDEVARLSKEEANAFTQLAGFVWCIRFAGGEMEPILVVDKSNPLCKPNAVLMQTALVDHFSLGIHRVGYSEGTAVDLHYYNRGCLLKIRNSSRLNFGDGHFELSSIGRSLFPICGGEPIRGEFERMLEKWSKSGVFEVVSSYFSGPS